MSLGDNPSFIVDILQGAEALYGSGRDAASEMGLAKSTFNDIVNGVTLEPSQGTIDKVTTWFAEQTSGFVSEGHVNPQFDILSAADVFKAAGPGGAQELRDLFHNDREAFKEVLDNSRGVWINQQKAREEQGLPPLEGASG